MSEPVIVFNDRYHILGELGQGGMAIVYRAHDRVLGRTVALKVLHLQYANDPIFLARFQAEARAAAALAHPNIVDVYDVGQDGDRYFIVMEYVQGCDLKNLIHNQGPLSVSRAVDLAVQICAAVGYAHRNGLIHRDVKPHNVLVTADDRIKVTDFGIARAVAEAAPTEPGTIWGTAQYLAPEQALGKPVSPASDVYTLGVVLFEMLAGRLPFEGDTRDALVIQHIQADPPPLHQLNPQVPALLEAIVNQAMAKEPTGRYSTADELGRALRAYRHQGEEMTTPISGIKPGVISNVKPSVISSAESSAPAASVLATQPRRSVDWQTVILGLLAVIALLGLIPLWIRVYTVYVSRAAAIPLPCVVRQLEPDQARWWLSTAPGTFQIGDNFSA